MIILNYNKKLEILINYYIILLQYKNQCFMLLCILNILTIKVCKRINGVNIFL